MVTFIRASGLTTKPTGLASTFTMMVPFIRVTGRMTNSMDMVLKLGLMKLATKELTLMDLNMAKVPFAGRTALVTQDNSVVTTSQVLANTSGAMGATMKASGMRIKCTATESLSGMMAVSI